MALPRDKPGLFDDNVGKPWVGADGGGVKERAVVDLVGIMPEDFGEAAFQAPIFSCSAAGEPPLLRDSEQDRNVFVTVEAVGDEKWNDDDIRRFG